MSYVTFPSLPSLMPRPKPVEGAVMPEIEGSGPFAKLLMAAPAPSSPRAEEEGQPALADADAEDFTMAQDAEGEEPARPPADPVQSRFWGTGIPIRDDGPVAQADPDAPAREVEAPGIWGEFSPRDAAFGVQGPVIGRADHRGDGPQDAAGTSPQPAAKAEVPHGGTDANASSEEGSEASVQLRAASAASEARAFSRSIPSALDPPTGLAAQHQGGWGAAASAPDARDGEDARVSDRPSRAELAHALPAEESETLRRSLMELRQANPKLGDATWSPAGPPPGTGELRPATVTGSAPQPPVTLAEGALAPRFQAGAPHPPTQAQMRPAPPSFRDGGSEAQHLPAATLEAARKEEAPPQFVGGTRLERALAEPHSFTGKRTTSAERAAQRGFAVMLAKEPAPAGPLAAGGPAAATSVGPELADLGLAPQTGAARGIEGGSLAARAELAAPVLRTSTPVAVAAAPASHPREGGEPPALPVSAPPASQSLSMPRQSKAADQGIASLARPHRAATALGLASIAHVSPSASQIRADASKPAPGGAEPIVSRVEPELSEVDGKRYLGQRHEAGGTAIKASRHLQNFLWQFPASTSVASAMEVEVQPYELRSEPISTQVVVQPPAPPAPRGLVISSAEMAARSDTQVSVGSKVSWDPLPAGDPVAPVSPRESGDRHALLQSEPSTVTRAKVAPAAPMGSGPSGTTSPAFAPQTETSAVAGKPLDLQLSPLPQGEGPLPPSQTEGAARPPAPNEAARASPPPLQQIAQAIRENDGRGVEIRLQPEELGSVRITLRQDGELLRVHLQAERSETLDLMRRSTADLALNLQLSGHAQTRFSFDASGRDDRAEPEAMGPEAESRSDPLPPTFVPRRGEGGRLDLRL